MLKKSVMPKGDGIAQKPPPENLEELITPPWIEAEKKFNFSA